MEGTQKLSAVVRRNEYFDNLVNESNRLRNLRKIQIDEFMKQGLSRDEAAKRAVAPIFANSETEAAELFGGMYGADWRETAKVVKTPTKMAGAETLGPLDYRQTLRPLAGEKRSTFLKKGAPIGQIPEEIPIHNPLAGKYALNGVVDGLVEPVESLFQSKNFGTQLYANFILYPKATSQMAKTILSPVTHVRNLVSAGAFSAANGIIPFLHYNPKMMYNTFRTLDVALPGSRAQAEAYEELVRLGVVNTNVSLGDLRGLLKDIDFGAKFTAERGMRGIMKPLSKIKKWTETS